MKTNPQTVAAIYTAWLAKQGMNAKEAAPLVGCSIATSYQYASGLSVPPGTKIRDFAARIGHDPESLAAIARRDRPRCRRRKRTSHDATNTKVGAA